MHRTQSCPHTSCWASARRGQCRAAPGARAQQPLALLAAQEGDVLDQVGDALLPLALVDCTQVVSGGRSSAAAETEQGAKCEAANHATACTTSLDWPQQQGSAHTRSSTPCS